MEAGAALTSWDKCGGPVATEARVSPVRDLAWRGSPGPGVGGHCRGLIGRETEAL